MDTRIFQIDLLGADFDPKDIYSEVAAFFTGLYLTRIEEDGDMIPANQIKSIPPSETSAFLGNYQINGSHLETLVAHARPIERDQWELIEKLPCVLNKESASNLKYLMRRNDWNHYICLAQTQVLIGTTSCDFYRVMSEGRYASSIEVDQEEDL
jgi:hypothetical protein